jgi:hypothetical protein
LSCIGRRLSGYAQSSIGKLGSSENERKFTDEEVIEMNSSIHL